MPATPQIPDEKPSLSRPLDCAFIRMSRSRLVQTHSASRFAVSAAVKSEPADFDLQYIVRGKPTSGALESIPETAFQRLSRGLNTAGLFLVWTGAFDRAIL
jgi:hypothetical protein